MTHSLYVKLSKNSKDYGEPNITYQQAGSAEQRLALGLCKDGCRHYVTCVQLAAETLTLVVHQNGSVATDSLGDKDVIGGLWTICSSLSYMLSGKIL